MNWRQDDIFVKKIEAYIFEKSKKNKKTAKMEFIQTNIRRGRTGGGLVFL